MPGVHERTTLVGRYGPLLVFAVVALQALCVPLPGTTALIAAALYAGIGQLGGLRRIDPGRVGAAAALVRAQAAKLAFFARWITGLRNVAGLVCGAVGMRPARLAAASLQASLVWAATTGLEYYWFGRAIESASTWVQAAMIVLALVWMGLSLALLRRRAVRLVVGSQQPQAGAKVPARSCR